MYFNKLDSHEKYLIQWNYSKLTNNSNCTDEVYQNGDRIFMSQYNFISYSSKKKSQTKSSSMVNLDLIYYLWTYLTQLYLTYNIYSNTSQLQGIKITH